MPRIRTLSQAFLLNAFLCGAAAAAAGASPVVARGEPLVEAISIGLVISLIFSETLGLATGGMIVPGYIALVLHDPKRVAGTIVVALATYAIVRFLSRYMLIYGRRRTVIIILVGFTLGSLSRQLYLPIENTSIALASIGFIIPGLIADWMERQGLVQTVSSLILASVFTRLLLIAIGPRTFL